MSAVVERKWPDDEAKLKDALSNIEDIIQDIKAYPESVVFRTRAKRYARRLFENYLSRKSRDYKANRQQFFSWMRPQFPTVIELVKFIG